MSSCTNCHGTDVNHTSNSCLKTKPMNTPEPISKDTKSKKLTSDKWLEKVGNGTVILDPDGWDRKNYQYSFYEELITEQEFNHRLMQSTIMRKQPMSDTKTLDELRENILTEFKQVLKLAPSDYTENCTNVVMSMVSDLISRQVAEERIDELSSLYIDFDERKIKHFNGIKLESLDDRMKALEELL